MIVNQETNNLDKTCEHCNRTFVRDSTLLKHVCEQKRRWLDKDKTPNRIGYNAWKNYYNTHHPSKKNTDYADFLTNTYYSAFVKFGQYCSDVNAINPNAYANYLLKNKVPIDSWPSDRSYTSYLIEYLKSENCFDAVKRTMDTLLTIAKDQNIQLNDVFIYANTNKLCHLITLGKISPWVLYNSKTGIEFLSRLDESQTNLIFEYIDPQRWNIKFKRDEENLKEIKHIINTVSI
jgi:hypothetical protein